MRAWRAFGLSVLALAGALPAAQAKNASVAYQKRVILGIPVNIVKVDLNDPDVRVTAAIARGGLGRSERFKSLINRVHPAAAITGTFFDTHSLLPVGDIIVEGREVCKGMVGTGVAFGGANQIDFVPLNTGRADAWAQYKMVLCAGPWLVKNGIRTVRPWAEGFHDRSLYALRPRAAIGLTKYHKLLLITVEKPVYYTHVSKIMKALGAVNALGLDGGSSTALSIRGKIISKPGRRLTNVLLVYDKPFFYERAVARNRLMPGVKRPAPEPLPLEMITVPDTPGEPAPPAMDEPAG